MHISQLNSQSIHQFGVPQLPAVYKSISEVTLQKPLLRFLLPSGTWKPLQKHPESLACDCPECEVTPLAGYVPAALGILWRPGEVLVSGMHTPERRERGPGNTGASQLPLAASLDGIQASREMIPAPEASHLPWVLMSQQDSPRGRTAALQLGLKKHFCSSGLEPKVPLGVTHIHVSRTTPAKQKVLSFFFFLPL